MANVTAKTSSNIFYKARCEAATHNEQLSSREGAADYEPCKGLHHRDEPTSGLNNADISKFEKVLFALQEKGNTILIVEHNIEFISHVADYIVDFGLVGGNAGGKIVSQGCPQDVFENEKSSLFGLKY